MVTRLTFAGPRSGHFGEGREPVERGPEPVGGGRPGPREALGIGQLGPVIGMRDLRA